MQYFEEINVERINVVDAEGKRRFVITHGGRHPDPRRRGPGAAMLFFNDEGQECGGIAFSGSARNGSYDAGAVIALDQFRDDQCVFLIYEDDNGRRRHGLQVVERHAVTVGPDGSTIGREDFPANTRLFAGRADDGSVVVSLNDRLGRPRLRLSVDAQGNPRIEMLDGEGHVTFALSPESKGDTQPK